MGHKPLLLSPESVPSGACRSRGWWYLGAKAQVLLLGEKR